RRRVLLQVPDGGLGDLLFREGRLLRLGSLSLFSREGTRHSRDRGKLELLRSSGDFHFWLRADQVRARKAAATSFHPRGPRYSSRALRNRSICVAKRGGISCMG